MRKICLSLLFLMGGTQISHSAEIVGQLHMYPYEEKLNSLETFAVQNHIFDYLCQQCKMPPEKTIFEVYTESLTLGIPQSKALEDIMTAFHLNVTAQVSYRTIEQVSLSFEEAWDKISNKKTKKK